jgi:hypothetical protein
LHANADRVTELVDKANAAHEKLEGSTARIGESSAKIDEAEKIMAKLLSDLQVFEASQVDSSPPRRRPPWRALTASSPPLSRALGRT